MSARFDRAGEKIATASWDKTARVWDVATGLPLADPFRHGGRVDFAEFSSDGERVVTASGDSTARLWETPDLLPPVAPWLLDLAESLAGQRLDEQGVVHPVSVEELVDLMKRLTNSPASDRDARWAHWFLADRAGRTISPVSEITLPGYLQSRLEEDTLESLQEAVRLSPTNGLALARLAKQTLARDAQANPRRLGEADFLSGRAARLAPNDPEVERIRAGILGQIHNGAKP